MPAATLVYNATPTTLGSLEVDCTVSESHTAENDVTMNPVEGASARTDHIRPMPEQITIEGLVSGTPTPKGTGRVATHTDPSGKTHRFTSAVSESDSTGGISRLEAAAAALYKILNGGELVTVVTGTRTYENMAMKSLAINKTAKTGFALPFTAVFIQVKTVDLLTTERLASQVSGSALGAKPLQKDGKQPTKEYTSVLMQAGEAGVDSVTDTIGALRRNLP